VLCFLFFVLLCFFFFYLFVQVGTKRSKAKTAMIFWTYTHRRWVQHHTRRVINYWYMLGGNISVLARAECVTMSIGLAAVADRLSHEPCFLPLALRWTSMFGAFQPVVVSGDRFVATDRALVVSNHVSDIDWLYLWRALHLHGAQNSVASCTHINLTRDPGLFLAVHMSEAIAITRGARGTTRAQLASGIAAMRPATWLMLFPTGNIATARGVQRERGKRGSLGLRDVRYTLTPHVAPVHQIIATGQFDTIYDVTITYAGMKRDFDTAAAAEGQAVPRPPFADTPHVPNAYNFVRRRTEGEVRIHVRRVPLPRAARSWSIDTIANMMNMWWGRKERAIRASGNGV
jgi:hypothetical protein